MMRRTAGRISSRATRRSVPLGASVATLALPCLGCVYFTRRIRTDVRTCYGYFCVRPDGTRKNQCPNFFELDHVYASACHCPSRSRRGSASRTTRSLARCSRCTAATRWPSSSFIRACARTSTRAPRVGSPTARPSPEHRFPLLTTATSSRRGTWPPYLPPILPRAT